MNNLPKYDVTILNSRGGVVWNESFTNFKRARAAANTQKVTGGVKTFLTQRSLLREYVS